MALLRRGLPFIEGVHGVDSGATQRRLTTIVVTDVVGYSRMMAADEAGTMVRLKALRADVIDPRIADFDGRVVKLMGDGLVIEFGSVVNALAFAVDVQREAAARAAAEPAEPRIELRIGINTGDVIVEDDDLYGDGMNVAARLEPLAEPGGICVSEKVRAEVGDRLDVVFEDMGAKRLKNLPEPVRVFRVRSNEAGPARLVPGLRRRWPTTMIAAAVVLAVVGAALFALRPWQPATQPASTERMAYPLPDRPSIVVLPFNNISGDSEQDYFADGITEDLTTDLAKISSMFVISRNSAFSYKGRSVTVREVAEELSVRYVLEGSVRRVRDEVRINAQLIDATTGGHLWAERYDGEVSDVFALQDRVARRIVKALALELTPDEAPRVDRRGTTDPEAYDAYLLGQSAYYQRTPEANANAAHHFERAITLDPNYSAAYTALAKVYVRAVVLESAYAEALGIFWTDGYLEARRLLQRGAEQPNADVHVLRSWLALTTHQHDRAIAEAHSALELNPNDAEALEALAEALAYAGRPREAIDFARRAMRQNPTLEARPLYLIGLAEFARGRPGAAVEQVERAIEQAPRREADYPGLLAAAYGELGTTDRAEAAFRDFSDAYLERPRLAWQVRADPFANPRYHTWRRIDLAWSVYSFPFAGMEPLDRLAEGLVAAGAPRSVGGYLPLTRANRLSGAEIEELLFGRAIAGRDFWLSSFTWRQERDERGRVSHSGYPIHPGLPEEATGKGRVRDDMLCDRWPALSGSAERCVVVFRVSTPKARVRWGDYVMVTETGPNPFSVVK